MVQRIAKPIMENIRLEIVCNLAQEFQVGFELSPVVDLLERELYVRLGNAAQFTLASYVRQNTETIETSVKSLAMLLTRFPIPIES